MTQPHGSPVAPAPREQQEAVELEHRHLLGLFEQSPGFTCFLAGRELVFELANAAYLQLVGHRDILGKAARAALPEIEGQGFFELLDSVYTTGEPFVGRAMRLLVQRKPDASPDEAFIDFIYQPIRGTDGVVMGVLVQGYEVTEAKRQEVQREVAEDALKASEERFRTLFQAIDDGFCLIEMKVNAQGVTVDYRFLETNAAFEGHTGLNDAVGKMVLELIPDLDPSWFRFYGGVATTGVAARIVSYEPTLKRWFDLYANRVGAPERRQVAIVLKDVTARKRAEAEREELLARETAARHEAEEAGRLRDDFLATVSHELRTPLNSMLGWVQMLRAGSLSPDKRDRALETIERNARSQSQLIDDLLDVSRILAGKFRLEIDVVDLEVIVESAIETVRPAAAAREIRLQAALASGETVMGDAQRLQQVVWNLLTNAVKFTPKGGRVQVFLERRDSSVELTIADTGQGIAKEFQSHVFERFRQADGGTTRVHGGLGLGLAIVRQIVEMHGGSVEVFSDGEGKGSSFTVRLPVAATRRRDITPLPALQSSVGTPGVRRGPQLDGLSVLLVDDEEDTREMLRTLLEEYGVRVRVAASVAEAMVLFETKAPDVLLSDIGMPGEDGYALIERVRNLSSAAGADVPAVALTAYTRTADRTRALLSGFTSHVPKPVEPLELIAVLAALSGRGRKRPR